MNKYLKVGDKVCIFSALGYIVKVETIERLTATQAVTDQGTRFKIELYYYGDKAKCDQIGDKWADWYILTDELQKLSDAAKAISDIRIKVIQKWDKIRIHSLSIEQLQRLDEAINWIE